MLEQMISWIINIASTSGTYCPTINIQTRGFSLPYNFLELQDYELLKRQTEISEIFPELYLITER